MYLFLLTEFISKPLTYGSYQSIKIPQLECPVYRAPHCHLHEKRDIYKCQKYQKGKIESEFSVTTWISSKLKHNKKGHVVPTLTQFHVCRTSIVKVTFNRNSGECLAPDTHFTAASWKGIPSCPGSVHTSHLSAWTPAQHSVTAESYSNACEKLSKTVISAARNVLC